MEERKHRDSLLPSPCRANEADHPGRGGSLPKDDVQEGAKRDGEEDAGHFSGNTDKIENSDAMHIFLLESFF